MCGETTNKNAYSEVKIDIRRKTDMLNLGVIGCGKRASRIIKLLTDSGEVKLTAITDTRGDELKKLVSEQGFRMSATIPMLRKC